MGLLYESDFNIPMYRVAPILQLYHVGHPGWTWKSPLHLRGWWLGGGCLCFGAVEGLKTWKWGDMVRGGGMGDPRWGKGEMRWGGHGYVGWGEWNLLKALCSNSKNTYSKWIWRQQSNHSLVYPGNTVPILLIFIVHIIKVLVVYKFFYYIK